MTPQERQLVDELFERLASLENQPRDAEAERAIAAGLARAPHAPYALVQTVLVQDEALRQAEEHIRELGGDIGEPPRENRSFLDEVRETLLGRDERPRRGSVPLVRQGVPTQGGPMQPQPEPVGRGGSFLGTAAATAAGVIGGSLLINSLSSMFGRDQAQAGSSAFGDTGRDTPWGSSAGNSDLAREAGINDIGSAREDRLGWLDNPEDNSDIGGDGGFGFGGDTGGSE